MPRTTRNNPDLIDLDNLLHQLGESYAVVVYFTVRVRNDRLEIVGKTHGTPYSIEAPVQHVALVSYPIQQPRDMATAMYTIAFDLWCQHDGAGATAARRGPPIGWNGKVEGVRGRNKG